MQVHVKVKVASYHGDQTPNRFLNDPGKPDRINVSGGQCSERDIVETTRAANTWFWMSVAGFGSDLDGVDIY